MAAPFMGPDRMQDMEEVYATSSYSLLLEDAGERGMRASAPLVRELQAAPERQLREDRLLEALEQTFSPQEARRQLDTAIDWGRYAELFAYDDDAGEFFLEEEGSADSAV